ncbi:hypothetical protein [Burkholderia sp. BE17]|uniref:hypothetical protein n=1 Tax=Burkholderia sp. BE17 TaxID=2656644 RepID=UPI00128BE50B|nr:hypothetical protein [Burkholderia sp. BE17]MPV65857.1 hypothetical protein [Burkholderia sp. BE17]
MNIKHVVATGLADRLTLDEAADFVARETGKLRDYVISYLTDCAEQGYFLAEVVLVADYENVSHISRVDSSKSTLSSAALIEWLNDEIEDAHQKARVAIARKETNKWGYPGKPEDVRVHLIPWSEQLDDLSRDEAISMTAHGWTECFARDVAEGQRWEGKEYDAKFGVVWAEYLNIFVALADTLPLTYEVSGLRWRGAQLPSDWLTSLLLEKGDLREWAKIHAPEIAKSRLLAEPNLAVVNTESPEQATEIAMTSAVSTSGPSEWANTGSWQDKARGIADELFDHDTSLQTRDSLKNYSKRVMNVMQERQIHGPRGRIDNPLTVQREALQGDKWWAKKQK